MNKTSQPFRFKEFSIHQDKTAMKVGTDGVLLGAWASVFQAKKILDVGTGTGLIALMLAQRNPTAIIDAIEIDVSAYEQAKHNIQESKFQERISVILTDFSTFSSDQKYDCIVSNPPYFEENKRMQNSERKTARQQNNLSYHQLCEKASELLATNGRLQLILPFASLENIQEVAKGFGLFCNKICFVKGHENAAIIRVLLEFSFEEKSLITEDLTIEKERHVYTEDYIALTKAFYLKM